MGFRGRYVVHRGEPLLAKVLPDVTALHDATIYAARMGTWQVLLLSVVAGILVGMGVGAGRAVWRRFKRRDNRAG
ncbi:hypothetical protein [Planosporangium mesophilum]|uniref:Uncharacterized protein n=1 Tax=Planosporangium mesophilum TaxID=689768 RepID=A0A8J3TB36_9ACTN|nr:hypothetical protein [Planosporangium mesophilum]NJC85851.1 hypothetical protein [Planosporangium mesophilum]GII21912.1 hypothetical protein Pme01_15090 [Planosporangium mesophilum]